ncbi:NAD(P)-dependent oxidoreductase [Halalkalibacter sp. APA_J-10(15)]|uniref:NAD-dependent epimerase/dehydratase family protein n=1 Tax=Halalkalibacter sp. APA_J-10(15) TaxID=2933805 RepID=UPI001FF3A9D2|nr:NAD(P)-dependent oxidoreductase [Halalkalibacter sp. APA_J-10(15)]MCK0472656.1 NAD(P)-dependent oxidoreductase [Halalkalibacter sp. APA_J-10(15)]
MGRALVTGGLGFIGFHLCERLLNEGYEVILVDSMRDDIDVEKEEKWMRIGRNASLTFHNEMIENMDLKKMMKKVDIVFHLAALTHADSKWPRLTEVIEKNVTVTERLIHASTSETRFVYASTVEVYGERPGKITEKTSTNPTSPYGITKLASERLIMRECKKKGIPYYIFRLPTVYGPWQRSDMMFQQLLLGNENANVDRSTADLLYVEDCVDGLLLAATTKKHNEVYHLSTGRIGEWFSGLTLINKDHPKLAHKRPTVHVSNHKATDDLGYQVKTSLQEGIAKQKQHVEQWQRQVSRNEGDGIEE